jgi:hypothetical protein
MVTLGGGGGARVSVGLPLRPTRILIVCLGVGLGGSLVPV